MNQKIWILFAATIFLTPLLLCPLTVDYYHPPKELLVQLSFIICIAMWLIDGIRKERFEIPRNKLYVFLIGYCGLACLSLIWASSRYSGVRDLAQLLSYAGMFFICVNIVRFQREAVTIAKFAFIAGLLAAIYAVFQYFGLDFIRYPSVNFADWRFKLYSTFGNPDFLANYLVTVFPLGVALYLSTENLFKRVLLLFALGIMYYTILITFSVGALFGFAAAVIFAIQLFILDGCRFKSFALPKGAASSLAAFIIVLGLLSVFLPPLVLQAKSSQVWRSGLKNRMMSYRAAYRMAKEHPVLGVGIGNFKFRYPEYRGKRFIITQQYHDSQALDKERHMHVHNDYAQVWAETGIFGAIIFGLILLIIFKDGLSLYLDTFGHRKKLFIAAALCGLAAFLVHAAVSFPMHVVPNALLFWVLAGLIYSQAEQDMSVTVLNMERWQKRVLEVGVIVLAVLLCLWPLKNYLSEVFLKRMVDLDRQGNIEGALTEANTSLFFNPDSNAIIYVGNYAFLAKNYDKAEDAYLKALSNNDEINYRVALAETYYNDGMIRESSNEYKKALLLNPCSWPMRLRLAEIYTQLDMDNEAQVECEYLVINFPNTREMKDRLKPILNKIAEKRFLSAYGPVKINK